MKISMNIFMIVLGALVTIGYFVTIALCIVFARPETQAYVPMLIGSLITAFSSVIFYFYGSSKGSSDKNQILMNNKTK